MNISSQIEEQVQDWQHRYDQIAFAKGSVDAGVNGVIREILSAHASQTAEQRREIQRLEAVNACQIQHTQQQIAELERKLADAEGRAYKAERREYEIGKQMQEDCAKLFAAEAHIGVLKHALSFAWPKMYDAKRDYGCDLGACIELAKEALASSPVTTLKERAVEVLKRIFIWNQPISNQTRELAAQLLAELGGKQE